MNYNSTDQEWQRLKASIEKLSGKYPGEELRKIEYKPRNAIYLLEMPPEHKWKSPGSL
jgi:hypothetical protein